jgi:hypothetical protein
VTLKTAATGKQLVRCDFAAWIYVKVKFFLLPKYGVWKANKRTGMLRAFLLPY